MSSGTHYYPIVTQEVYQDPHHDADLHTQSTPYSIKSPCLSESPSNGLNACAYGNVCHDAQPSTITKLLLDTLNRGAPISEPTSEQSSYADTCYQVYGSTTHTHRLQCNSIGTQTAVLGATYPTHPLNPAPSPYNTKSAYPDPLYYSAHHYNQYYQNTTPFSLYESASLFDTTTPPLSSKLGLKASTRLKSKSTTLPNPKSQLPIPPKMKDLPCPSCPLLFARGPDLQRHIDGIHLRIRHHCSVSGCRNNGGRGYCREEKLRKHVLEVHGTICVEVRVWDSGQPSDTHTRHFERR